MNINIIAGGCNELNDLKIFSILKNRDKSKRHIIVAPDRSLFSIEQRLFDETNEDCYFDIDVMSLNRLSSRVIGSNSEQKILTKQSGVALVKKLLIENSSNLLAFGKASSFMGFANSLFDTICLYKSCGLSYKDIVTDDSDNYSNLKQKDIKLIYEKYEEYLTNGYTDSLNQLMVFSNLIDKDTFANTIFYFVEFEDFTSVVYSIILKLSKFADGFYVTCPYGKGNNSKIYLNKTYGDLIDLYKTNGLEFNISFLDGFGIPYKDFLLNNLLSYNTSTFELSNSNISINSFNNFKDEFRFVLADIYSKCIMEKIDYSSFTILVPSINDYKSVISNELKLYDIPCYFDETKVLLETSLIRLLFDIINLLSNNFSYYDFSNVIKSPLLNFNVDNVLDYDNKLILVGAVGNMCLNIDFNTCDVTDFCKFILDIKNDVDFDKAVFDVCLDVCNKIFDYILSRCNNYLESLNPLEYKTFNQVIKKYNNLFNDCHDVFGNCFTSFDDFVEIFKSYFSSSNVSLPPITSNTLFVADFNSSFINSCDYLYILGCNEGVLPKYKIDNGIITDDDISAMPNSKMISPTVWMLNKRKQFKLFDSIFRYKKGLILNYNLENNEGKLYPNVLVDNLTKIYDFGVTNKSNLLDDISNSYYNLNVDNIVFNNLTPKISKNNLVKKLYNWNVYCDNDNYRQMLTSLTKVNNLDTVVNDFKNRDNADVCCNLTKINFFPKHKTSVSEVECFYGCPYKHFVRYGLRLKDSLVSEIQAFDIGNILHAVLRELIPLICQNVNDDELNIKNAERILSKVLKDEKYLHIVDNVQNVFVIKSLYNEIHRITLAVARELKLSSYKPTKFEMYFDKVIEFNGISVCGAIDRVDECDNNFMIIDYKTGDNQFKNYNDVYSGKKLQLLVYAKAYENLSNKNIGGAFYMPLSNTFGDENTIYRFNGVMINDDSNIVSIDRNLGICDYKSPIVNLKRTKGDKIFGSPYYKNMCITKGDFDYLLDYSIKQVERAIGRIMLGEITPMPLVDGDKSACDYCDYLAICNYAGSRNREIENIENIQKLKEKEGCNGGI